MDGNVHEMWSEDELDRALATLHSDVDIADGALAGVRAELMTAAGGPSPRHRPARRHWARWALAAAAVVALVAGLLVVQTVQFGDHPPAASAAAAALNSTADKIRTSDPPLRPGQYRYVGWHSWAMNTAVFKDTSLTRLEERLGEMWVPQDWKRDWLVRDGSTGNYKWIKGSDQEAKALGFAPPKAETTEERWPCGQYPHQDNPCGVRGSWQQPTPEWMAGLPRDPQKLYERLRADAPVNGRGDTELLVYAADALRSAIIPADLRAAIYRALGKLPALEITDQLANLDGRTGIAYGMNDGTSRQEIIIDPATGQYIGARQLTTRALPELPANAVMSYSSVVFGVVDNEGTRP